MKERIGLQQLPRKLDSPKRNVIDSSVAFPTLPQGPCQTYVQVNEVNLLGFQSELHHLPLQGKINISTTSLKKYPNSVLSGTCQDVSSPNLASKYTTYCNSTFIQACLTLVASTQTDPHTFIGCHSCQHLIL